MKRKEKYNYAMKILNENKVKTLDNALCFNGRGAVVIHSKQLKNCIIIEPQATEKTIKANIGLQLKIANII